MTSDSAAPGAAAAPVGDAEVHDAVRRVRHQARDALTLMSFSLVVSVTTALGVLALTHLGL